MTKTLTVTEMSRKFAEYINRVAYRGDRFILTRGNRPVAEISPLPSGVTGREFLEIWESLPHLTPEEADEFGRDIEVAREELDKIPVRDPWED
jgi:prevent-host-death family protein